jgi:hypothetical protein
MAQCIKGTSAQAVLHNQAALLHRPGSPSRACLRLGTGWLNNTRWGREVIGQGRVFSVMRYMLWNYGLGRQQYHLRGKLMAPDLTGDPTLMHLPGNSWLTNISTDSMQQLGNAPIHTHHLTGHFQWLQAGITTGWSVSAQRARARGPAASRKAPPQPCGCRSVLRAPQCWHPPRASRASSCSTRSGGTARASGSSSEGRRRWTARLRRSGCGGW